MHRQLRARAGSGYRRALAVWPAALGSLLAGGCLPAHDAPPALLSTDLNTAWPWLTVGAVALAGAALGALGSRQRIQPALQRAQAAAAALRQLHIDGLWRTDAQHRLLEWQAPAGSSDAQWVGMPSGSLLTDHFESTDPAAPGGLQARLSAAVPLQQVTVRARTDGQRWQLDALPCVDGDGRFDGYLGRARPLAAVEQAQQDQAVLGALWAAGGPASLLLVTDDGGAWQVLRANHEACKLVHCDNPDALSGIRWDDLRQRLPGELPPALGPLLPGVVEQGGWRCECHAVPQPPGPPALRLLCLHPLAPAQAPPAATAATQATVAPAVSASDREEQESFIYSISHDLRAPIRVVEGFSRILKEDYGRFLDRIGNDHVDRVLAAAARMHSMIDALLALSRLQSQPLARKPVDLSQLATYVMEDLRRDQPERLAELMIEPGIVVQGDPTLLRIALENLLGNAWKYSGQCPTTHIEFRRDRQGGQSVLVVADHGAGFDMRFADRLFGVFQRLHSAKDFQGTGVGLASVRRIIRRHGGDIWADAEVGKGARFYFTLGPVNSAAA
jgi:anti-sigma regulatory factor (Ser/Thr protein kinase)